MTQQRRRFDAADKVKIIREHLLDKRPLSEVCRQYGIAPTRFYQGQKQFFEHGTAAFDPPGYPKSIGYITPLDKLEGRADAIQAQRQRKLIAAREARKQQRKAS